MTIDWQALLAAALHGAYLGLAGAAVVDWHDLQRDLTEQGLNGISVFLQHFKWKVALRKYAVGALGGAAMALGIDKLLPLLHIGGAISAVGLL